MRRIRDMLGILLLIHAGMLGCATTEPQIKPPKPPEEYNEPPANDRRYSGPIEYPKETMETDPLLKKAAKDKKQGAPGPTMSPSSQAGRMGSTSGY
jgi:hypothetical protein